MWKIHFRFRRSSMARFVMDGEDLRFTKPLNPNRGCLAFGLGLKVWDLE